MPADVAIRAARETDLSDIFDVFYANEVLGEPDPPPRGDVPAVLRHILTSGTMVVAERGGDILGFAATITRARAAGDVSYSYLTDLFVRPDRQSSHVGRTLLDRVMPESGGVRFTVSSRDPRAQALYIRAGMQPQWPNYCLQRDPGGPDATPRNDVDVVEAAPGDPEIARWDAQISGRSRPPEHAFWVRDEDGVPLWLRRDGRAIGYAYVRVGAGSLHHPDACVIGPVGARTPADAHDCVLAVARWVQRRAGVVLIDIPGPHPALAPLLEARFRITYVETFHSSAARPFFDERCYVGSGGSLA